ncbi:MAG: AraC family transcriptional regulator [bacterium]
MRNEYSGTRDETGMTGMTLRTVWNVDQGRSYDIWRTGPVADILIAIRTHRGLGRIMLRHRTLELEPGTFLLVRNSAIQRYHCAAAEWAFWWFEFIANGSLPCGLEELIRTPLHMPAESAAVEEIMTSLRSPNAMRRMQASAGLAWLMTGWLASRSNPPPGQRVPLRQREAIERVVQTLHTRLDGGWTVPDMAAAAGMSERLFRNVFAAVTGIPPKLFYGRLRLDAAKEHLSLGQASIKELADMLGFSSPFHLSREFKRRFGVAPSSVRGRGPFGSSQAPRPPG